MNVRLLLYAALALSVFCPCPTARAQTPPAAPKVLLDMTEGMEKRATPSSGDVTVARSRNPAAPGLDVRIRPGQDTYPGIRLPPPGAPWDLSAFGHVEARLVNTGDRPLSVALRVDNAGDRDSPWNTESVSLAPGQAGTVTTLFGYSYGYKPGYALNPKAVVGVLLFTGKAEGAQSFRVESLTAAGRAGEAPPVSPDDLRVKPPGGMLLGPGVGIAAPQITADGGARAAGAGQRPPELRVTFPAGQGEASVSLTPALGRWDLRDFDQVRVRVRNIGRTPATPRVRLDSNGGPSDWVASAPLPPGADGEVAVPFAGLAPADLNHKGTGSQVTSDAVRAVILTTEGANAGRVLRVESVRAVQAKASPPDWLGKRPPVPGEWVQTLDDEFSGTKIDSSVWSVAGANYLDKTSHWSKADVLVGGGVVKLRYEKKTGYGNDDPTQKPTDYAAGYLDTYDKWAQRYGYFEARMKLPTAPGLWPAFWMMPDRGRAAGPEPWKRQDTASGGMEFDVMEHLDRWGPNRYNIAMHYDGYGKDHKSLGSDKIYVQPDGDGFLTCGLLWTPGSAVYYCNGREVLRWQDPRISDVPAILLFTLPMGGWDNDALRDARLPDAFTIDYVRVWQRKDLASPGDGKKPPP